MLTKRMAMRRMNEMWRRMALTLLFCGLLFHTCQGQTDQTSVMSQPGSTQSSPKDTTDTRTTHTPSSAANVTFPDFTDNFTNIIGPDIATHDTSRRLQTYTTTKDAAQALTTSKAVTYHGVNITETVKKSSIGQNKNSNSGTEGLEGLHNEKTGDDVSKPDQTNVFVPILVTGLILAAALIGVYVLKNHCHRKTTGMKLAEESYMCDDANQGNTLVSVAPLNPPESQEKPSQNGESLEGVKTQNPPAATNGHSTTKADTEL